MNFLRRARGGVQETAEEGGGRGAGAGSDDHGEEGGEKEVEGGGQISRASLRVEAERLCLRETFSDPEEEEEEQEREYATARELKSPAEGGREDAPAEAAEERVKKEEASASRHRGRHRISLGSLFSRTQPIASPRAQRRSNSPSRLSPSRRRASSPRGTTSRGKEGFFSRMGSSSILSPSSEVAPASPRETKYKVGEKGEKRSSLLGGVNFVPKLGFSKRYQPSQEQELEQEQEPPISTNAPISPPVSESSVAYSPVGSAHVSSPASPHLSPSGNQLLSGVSQSMDEGQQLDHQPLSDSPGAAFSDCASADDEAVELLSVEILSALDALTSIHEGFEWSHNQVKSWLHLCGYRPPNVLNCATRCATLRKERNWPMKLHARDVVDVLVTGAYQVLPGLDSSGRVLLLAALHAMDTERCPQEQYDKCLSYLLQDAAQISSSMQGKCEGNEGKGLVRCPRMVLIIDAHKDLTGSKTNALINFVLGNTGEESSCGWVTAKDGFGNHHLLCDPGLSCSPLVVSSVIVLNAGTMAKASLRTRRSSWGAPVAGTPPRNDRSGWLRRDISSARVGSPVVIIGGSAEEWEREIGEAGLGILPKSMGGKLVDWSIDLSISHKIQMEDLPADSLFISGMRSYLTISHALRCASTRASYTQVVGGCTEALMVPVTWVRRALGALEEASLAEAAPWRGRHGRGVREELVQLHKDMQRDVACINGRLVDMIRGKRHASDGMSAKDAVMDLLTQQIEASAKAGSVDITDVQCQLAARDILLSTKRTTSGGDMWVCIDSLCRNEKLVVICPSSEDAGALNIDVNYVPSAEELNGGVKKSKRPAGSTKKKLSAIVGEGRPISLRRFRRRSSGAMGDLDFANTDSRAAQAQPRSASPRLRRSASAEGALNNFDSGIEAMTIARRASLLALHDSEKGFVSVVCKTRLEYKICESNPLDEINTVLAFVTCHYERHFTVGEDGLEGSGVEASESTPLVSISIRSNVPTASERSQEHTRSSSIDSGLFLESV